MMKTLRIVKRIIKAHLILVRVRVLGGNITSIHFVNWTEPNHINREGFEKAISAVKTQNPNLFETGTSAYGIDSTRLFDLLAVKTKGKLISVDLSARPSNSLRFQLSSQSKLFVGDSVSFIENELGKYFSTVDLCYLDSWDVDWENPKPSELHGLSEFHSLKPFLKSGSVILIDDTPVDLRFIPETFHQLAKGYQEQYGYFPGKGALILREIANEIPKQFEVLHHKYNVLLRKI